jgi:moderate conductance mechanosensitive channel
MLSHLLPSAARLRAFGSALLLWSALGLSSATAAQTPVTTPANPAATPEDVQRLLAALNDPDARARLIGELNALLAAEQHAAPAVPATPSDWVARLFGQISDGMATITAEVAATGQMAREWRRATDWLDTLVSDPGERGRSLDLLVRLVIVAAGAIGCEWLVSLLIARPRRSIERWSAGSTPGRWLLLAARVVLALVPICAFVGAAYLILPLTTPDATTRLVAIALINANVLVRATLAIARRVLVPSAGAAPSAPRQRRLLRLDDRTARYSYRWVRRLSQVGIYGFFLVSAMSLLGVPRSVRDLLLRVVGLAVTVMLIALIVQNREAVARRIAGASGRAGGELDEWSLIRARFAEVWHVLAVGYVVGAFLVWALAVDRGFVWLASATVWTVVTLGALRLGLALLRRLTRHADRSLGDDTAGRAARIKALVPLVFQVLRGFLVVAAALAIAQAWGLDVRGAVTSPLGQHVLTSGFSIAVILAVAVAAWEIATMMIARSLTFGGALDSPRSGARLRTLLPLLRNALSVLIVVLTTLIVLSELGINIAPLLAGAGVVGLAIGFGAQTLVKDVITGLFFLLEDTVNVGDVVDVGGRSGFVESMSIRSIRLRDVEGSVHTVPFSAVAAIKNMTKDFGYSVHDLFVDYRSDLQHAIAVIGEVAGELRADQAYAAMITAPIEIMGVEKFADNAVVVRCRIKTVPVQRWAVGREFNRRLKLAFDRAGIGMVAAVPPPEPADRAQRTEDGKAPLPAATH